MDTHSAMIGPRSATSALQAVRDAETLAAYIGTCPTCLGWDDPEAESNERTPEPGRAVCPTCGLCSVEWDLAVAIQAELDRITRLNRLDAAVRAADAPDAADAADAAGVVDVADELDVAGAGDADPAEDAAGAPEPRDA